jgi:hypothetical protein
MRISGLKPSTQSFGFHKHLTPKAPGGQPTKPAFGSIDITTLSDGSSQKPDLDTLRVIADGSDVLRVNGTAIATGEKIKEVSDEVGQEKYSRTSLMHALYADNMTMTADETNPARQTFNQVSSDASVTGFVFGTHILKTQGGQNTPKDWFFTAKTGPMS